MFLDTCMEVLIEAFVEIPCLGARRSGGSGTRVVLLPSRGNPAAFLVAATGALFARGVLFFEAGSDDATSGGCGATVVATAGFAFSAMTASGRVVSRPIPARQREPSRGARRLELLSFPRFRPQFHSLGRLCNCARKAGVSSNVFQILPPAVGE